MAKQKGRALVVQIGDGESPEVFSVLCGLTTKTLTINTAVIDVTSADCTTPAGPLWREVMDGVRSVTVSGNGYFKDETAEARLRTVMAAAGGAGNFRVVVPDFGTFAGEFLVTSLEFGGEQDNGVTYGITLESSGAVTFTAA